MTSSFDGELSPTTEGRRRSSRRPTHDIPRRYKSLFYNVDGEPHLYSRLEKLHDSPNIYLVRDFLTPGDLDFLDRHITSFQKSFKASFTEGEDCSRLVSEERTSTFIHLEKGKGAVIRRLESKAAELIGLTGEFVEPLQIVSYTKGQKFELHHDAGTLADDNLVELVPPYRLVTLFVYLNNLPEGQGHTEFPTLNLSVRPERGCAVLFPNLLPSGEVDARTVHQACPVEGRLKKYGLNIWICEKSLSYMQDNSGPQRGQKTPKGFIEYSGQKSLLKEAERLTNDYEVNGAGIPWTTTGNKYIRAIVAAPFMVESDGEEEEEEEDELEDNADRGMSHNKRQKTSAAAADVSISDNNTKKGVAGGGGRKKEKEPRVYEQIFYGRVVKYAPPSSSSSSSSSSAKDVDQEKNDELFHILWDDGDSQDYDTDELLAGVTLYESLHSTSKKAAAASNDGDVTTTNTATADAATADAAATTTAYTTASTTSSSSVAASATADAAAATTSD